MEEQARMKDKEEQRAEERLCSVCMDAPRVSCLHPCGHTFCACCVGHVQHAAQLQRDPPLCPTCHVAFSSACRIFA